MLLAFESRTGVLSSSFNASCSHLSFSLDDMRLLTRADWQNKHTVVFNTNQRKLEEVEPVVGPSLLSFPSPSPSSGR